jgi:tRNA (uracil-5-)-methyltransferase TRM9
MTPTTIKKLNNLNLQFYQTVATDFDQTRQQPWNGWHQLLTSLKDFSNTQILDLGCGNGRLGVFLASVNPKKYLGFDASPELLSQAALQLQNTNVTFELEHLDIVARLETNQLTSILSPFTTPDTRTTNVFCLFGVVHHLPSSLLRHRLFDSLSQLMSAGDSVVISCWQFHLSPNLWQRRVEPNVIELEANELEENDYILDWQRGTHAYRYCHLTTEQEVHTLATQANLAIKESWIADGKNNNLNNYYLLAKKA